MSTTNKLRKSGIDILGDISWGKHFCVFYKNKKELLDILVPYFKEGLKNNEFCLWITFEPVGVEEAKEALGKVIKNLDDYIAKGQFEIGDYKNYYFKSGRFTSYEMLKNWEELVKKTLTEDFEGVRVTGDGSWSLGDHDFSMFLYESEVMDIISKNNIIALCSYSLQKMALGKIVRTGVCHQVNMMNTNGKWEKIDSSEFERVKKFVI